MSLFQCEFCGCCENTALASQGFKFMRDLYDWSYAPEREGMRLCSACGPAKYSDGTPTGKGVWHGKFKRSYLPMGMFVTNARGNLAHIETGDENFMAYVTVHGMQ